MEKDEPELDMQYYQLRKAALNIIDLIDFTDQKAITIYSQLKSLSSLIATKGIFSPNESIQEIKTEHLKYLTIPYFAGMVSSNINKDRTSSLITAKNEFVDFINLLKHYEGIDKLQYKIAKELMDGKYNEGLSSEDKRARTISQFKIKKSLENKVSELEKIKDEKLQREYWITYINYCVVNCLSTWSTMIKEIELLEYKKSAPKTEPISEPPKEGIKVVKIMPSDIANPLYGNSRIELKNTMLNNVFKPDHSLPTMTVEEWGEIEYQEMMKRERYEYYQ